MRLNYLQRIIFSFLGIAAGCVNILKSLVGLSPNCDLDGTYLQVIMEKLHDGTLIATAKQREEAQDEYRRRVRKLTSR